MKIRHAARKTKHTHFGIIFIEVARQQGFSRDKKGIWRISEMKGDK